MNDTRKNVDQTELYDHGLSSDEAARRLAQYGPNALAEEKESLAKRLFAYFWGPIPWMIEVAAILSAAVGRWEDFGVITVMLLINAGVGFFEEKNASDAIAALKQKLAPVARVERDGAWKDVPARELVPGDIIMVKLGNIVPADARAAKGDYASLDQSALTGESLPVDKKIGDTLYSGSIVRQGQMVAAVTATGMNTYFGKTAKLVETAQSRSHFQQAVLRIGNFLIYITLALVAVILLVALWRGDSLVETLLFCLILTVAAIPVALPAVMSVTMAVGSSLLARMKAIVSRLVSIEEMAGMDVLCTDKTGTLTKAELTPGDPVIFTGDAADLMRTAALTCDRDAPDAIDSAILKVVDAKSIQGAQVLKFTPFDPVHKRAEAQIRDGALTYNVAKGAPQAILELAGHDDALAQRVDKETEEFASHGYRTLGVAKTDASGKWRYLGLVPLFDPPRDDSAATIAEAEKLGLSIRMLTGDHAAIAREIAGKLHLGTNILNASDVFAEDGKEKDDARILTADGFAEVFPEHKFNIVKAFQRAGHIVGMTGDGVNDAPALKQADVGIAVSGATDAARAAAALVLTAPGLSTITRAIALARGIFERMTAYAIYRIAETVRILLFMFLSIVIFNFYPVTAVMIVLLALLNDLPVMMIAYDNVVVPPRPMKWDMRRVLVEASALSIPGLIASFGLFLFAKLYLRLPLAQIQTLIFLKLVISGHFTLYVTRNVGWFWQRPFPSWKLIAATETTQIVGTFAAVYGWFVTPVGWTYALLIWAYSLGYLLVNNFVKIAVLRLEAQGPSWHLRSMAQMNAPIHPHNEKTAAPAKR
ncbi:MAG TPA: plasma-membrane proton-efflux P-type ATPase [Rhizomicrobium sp.]|nr:plasma-membrane proton-efflux P-type ATPase [Rhizomicrobium sp.]